MWVCTQRIPSDNLQRYRLFASSVIWCLLLLPQKTWAVCSLTGYIERINCTKSNKEDYKRWVSTNTHNSGEMCNNIINIQTLHCIVIVVKIYVLLLWQTISVLIPYLTQLYTQINSYCIEKTIHLYIKLYINMNSIILIIVLKPFCLLPLQLSLHPHGGASLLEVWRSHVGPQCCLRPCGGCQATGPGPLGVREGPPADWVDLAPGPEPHLPSPAQQ